MGHCITFDFFPNNGFYGPGSINQKYQAIIKCKKNNEENIIDILKERLSIGKKEYSKFHDKNE